MKNQIVFGDGLLHIFRTYALAGEALLANKSNKYYKARFCLPGKDGEESQIEVPIDAPKYGLPLNGIFFKNSNLNIIGNTTSRSDIRWDNPIVTPPIYWRAKSRSKLAQKNEEEASKVILSNELIPKSGPA
ncbi:MAG: hypothetical protein JF616_21610 [Fibrobacteres bacterium]|nr:hypothetical protein [Fibrobacterota bacterium]